MMKMNHLTRQVLSFAFLLLFVAVGVPCARANIYGTNLILNGDAESGAGSYSGSDVLSVPHWNSSGNFTVAQYGVSSGVLVTCPGPSSRGSNYFAGGPINAASSAWQDVDVSAIGSDIDADSVVCNLSGWLGGWSGDNDNAKLTAYYINASGQTIGSLTLGPVLATDRGNVTALLYRQATIRMPHGTRTVRCMLTMTRVTGSYNDGYADNLSLILINSPPPAAPNNTNLLVNPGAELGGGSSDGSTVLPVPGWTTTGNFTVAQYGSSSDVTSSDPGPSSRGANYFYGGFTTSPTTASQDLDLYSRAAEIDTSGLSCNLSGWLGGWSVQNDNAQFTANFLDANNQSLGSLTIGPVTAADRANVSGLLYRSAVAYVPSGARTIRCTLLMTQYSGSYNDGLADNLSLTLSSAPLLTIVHGGGSVTVLWPDPAGDWTLQRTSNLSVSASWTDVAPPYQTSGNNRSYTFTGISSNSVQFFRLRR